MGPHRILVVLVPVVCLWMASEASADGGTGVTLNTLLAAGRDYHPTLARAPLLAKSRDLQRDQLNRAYWPQLALAGAASWQSDVTSVNVPIPGVLIPKPPRDQYKIALELQQSLWDGGATADRKDLADKRSEVEQQQVQAEWHQVRDGILQLYFAGLAQQELRAQAKDLVAHLDVVVANAQLALAQGVVTERDVLLARARQLEARQAAATAETQLSGVQRALEMLTGQSLTTSASLAPVPELCERPAPEALTAETIKRPELSLLDAQSDLLAAQETLDRAPDRPTLGAFATAGYGRPGLNALSSDFDLYFIGGLRVTVPLTYLYTDAHGKAHEQLTIQQALIERKRDAFMTQIQTQVDAQRTEIQRLDGALALDIELLEVRTEVRKQTEKQLELGTATMTELVNDLTQEDRSRTQLSLHRTERGHACHQLALIVGAL